MPYINKKDRDWFCESTWDDFGFDFEQILGTLSHAVKTIPSKKQKGALNYLVSRLTLQVFGISSYTEVSDGIAALQDAADEIKRRVLSKIEDNAIAKNGDLEEYGTN